MRSVIELLERHCNPGQGAQLFVWHRGRIELDVAVGEAAPGRRMQPDFIYRQYCALKPLGALLAATLASRGYFDLDEPIDRFLPEHRALRGRGITLLDLLDHSAGVHDADLRLCGYPKAVRHGVLRNLGPAPDWKVGEHQGYSDVAAWGLLEEVLQAVADEPVDRLVRTHVLEPLDLDQIWFGMDAVTQAELEPRLQYNWDLRTRTPLPLLGECTSYWLRDCHLAVGGYAPVRALGLLYVRLLEVLKRERLAPLSKTRLQTMLRSRRGRTKDAALGLDCAFASGFMVDLRSHVFGRRCPKNSFGHSGFFGGSFGFADPEAELVVAALWNTQVPRTEAQALRRARLTERIYAEFCQN